MTERRGSKVKPLGVRWGRVKELDKRIHVGTDTWKTAYPLRLQMLSAWRRLHKLRDHKKIRMAARALGVKPSSNMTRRQMVDLNKLLS